MNWLGAAWKWKGHPGGYHQSAGNRGTLRFTLAELMWAHIAKMRDTEPPERPVDQRRIA
jgi:hypothetical protein